MKKRRSLFAQYEFEIGVLTLPAYIVLLIFGVAYSDMFIAVPGFVGTITSTHSVLEGEKEIQWK